MFESLLFKEVHPVSVCLCYLIGVLVGKIPLQRSKGTLPRPTRQQPKAKRIRQARNLRRKCAQGYQRLQAELSASTPAAQSPTDTPSSNPTAVPPTS